ncbi:MAG: MarR family winged helix-turn-helix transcriptional regulator [Actinomycetota bacterium]|nr:MarR family winged helix-turn-helix transcriptional regulator [Actinomycetota bacterium]HZY66504.1 MarR family winged helix-turn-helix transcriptional regulator [Rubrobacteraceae bacterium]
MEHGGKEQIVEEVLLLLPVIGRLIDRSDAVELDEIERQGIPTDVHVSPGHIQIMIALADGPHSVRQLAEVVGVSSPAVTQLVDRLVEIGMVERRHDTKDRRVVLVDYVPGMQEIARRIVSRSRLQLSRVVERMTVEEAEAFLKGLKLLVQELGSVPTPRQREDIE